MKNGIDVSWAQGSVSWDKVKATGLVDFTYSRASDGIYAANDDPNFYDNHQRCRQLDIPFGAFHFFHFDQDPDAQASHFLSRIDGYTGQLYPMVDVEEGSRSSTTPVQTLDTFISSVEHALGYPMVIYTNADTWNTTMAGSDAFSGHPLWIADWTHNPSSTPTLPNGFTAWTIFQWTDKGSIDGVMGAVDRDLAPDLAPILQSNARRRPRRR